MKPIYYIITLAVSLFERCFCQGGMFLQHLSYVSNLIAILPPYEFLREAIDCDKIANLPVLPLNDETKAMRKQFERELWKGNLNIESVHLKKLQSTKKTTKPNSNARIYSPVIKKYQTSPENGIIFSPTSGLKELLPEINYAECEIIISPEISFDSHSLKTIMVGYENGINNMPKVSEEEFFFSVKKVANRKYQRVKQWLSSVLMNSQEISHFKELKSSLKNYEVVVEESLSEGDLLTYLKNIKNVCEKVLSRFVAVLEGKIVDDSRQFGKVCSLKFANNEELGFAIRQIKPIIDVTRRLKINAISPRQIETMKIDENLRNREVISKGIKINEKANNDGVNSIENKSNEFENAENGARMAKPMRRCASKNNEMEMKENRPDKGKHLCSGRMRQTKLMEINSNNIGTNIIKPMEIDGNSEYGGANSKPPGMRKKKGNDDLKDTGTKPKAKESPDSKVSGCSSENETYALFYKNIAVEMFKVRENRIVFYD